MVMKPSSSLLFLSAPFVTLLRPREFRLLLSLAGWSHLLQLVVVVVSVGFVASLIGALFALVTGKGDIAADIGAITNFVGCGGVVFP